MRRPERRRLQYAAWLQLQRALTALSLLVLAGLSGCAADGAGTSESAQAASPSGMGAFLEPCVAGADCAEGLCLALATGSGVCTHECARHAECPGGENWACTSTAETRAKVCVCAADSALEICDDGRDNDCDGKLDDCFACGARRVAPGDRLHCGGCGQACAAGEVCLGSTCVCPEGARCADPGGAVCADDGECDDGIACTRDACVSGSCVSELDPDACGAGTSCDPRAGACVAGPVCALDRDCEDGDACTVDERCDPSSRRCVYNVLDGDADGHAPLVCGGFDCDDRSAELAPGQAELCNARDDDCDGEVDEASASAACGAGMACVSGRCACTAGTVECGHACHDLTRDDDHCGRCGNACADGTVCSGGQCTCPADAVACEGTCRTPDSFADDPLHCGGCGVRCAGALESCVMGRCECAPAAVQCGDDCVGEAGFLGERAHCGGCDVRCEAACIVGSCAQPRALVTGMASTCVLFEDGRAACVGRVAGGSTPRALLDVDGRPLGAIAQLVLNDAASAPYLCALTSAGRVMCGGDPLLRSAQDPLVLTPVYARGLVPLDDVAELALGADASCALGKAGELWCWGPGYRGGLGAGEPNGSALALPVRDGAGTPLSHVVKVAALPLVNHVCALGAEGELWCWGDNSRGEVQPGGAPALDVATRVLDRERRALAPVRDVAVASGASCALGEAGTAQCWGSAGRGVLGRPGDGALGAAVVDAAGEVLRGGVALSSHYEGFCVVSGLGQLACWGANAYGQLGDGTTADRAYAVPVLSGVQVLASSLHHQCALRDGGELLCWGDEALRGSVVPMALTLFPQPLRDDRGAPLSAVRALGVGAQHSCILDGAGALLCWGSAGAGQLGPGADALRPRQFAWP